MKRLWIFFATVLAKTFGYIDRRLPQKRGGQAYRRGIARYLQAFNGPRLYF